MAQLQACQRSCGGSDGRRETETAGFTGLEHTLSTPAGFTGFAPASVVRTERLVAVLWFRVPFLGSLALLYAGMVLYLLAVIGVGLMISSVVRTQQQAILGAFLFLVPSIILSGFATPIANMSAAVQPITYLNPMRYFLVIVRGLFLQDLPADLVAQQLWPLALISLASLTAAGWLFRHRLTRGPGLGRPAGGPSDLRDAAAYGLRRSGSPRFRGPAAGGRGPGSRPRRHLADLVRLFGPGATGTPRRRARVLARVPESGYTRDPSELPARRRG